MDYDDLEVMEVFFDIYDYLPRGGPGNTQYTLKALSKIDLISENPNILDLGCGPGMQTIDLSKNTNGRIVAIDNHIAFLQVLKKNAEKKDLKQKIVPISADMFHLPFKSNFFDLIWSEGSLYFLGFEGGLIAIKNLLIAGGYIALTEAVWLKPNPPKIVADMWNEEYPGIDTIDNKIEVIKSCGYDLIDNFTLPKDAWFDCFYTPMKKRIETLKEKYENNPKALIVLDTIKSEIELYDKNSDYYGYEFFIMQNNM